MIIYFPLGFGHGVRPVWIRLHPPRPDRSAAPRGAVVTTAPPLVGHPGDLEGGTKNSLLTHLFDPAAGQRLEFGQLLVIAERLARKAPKWPGIFRPRRRIWDLVAASANFEAWVITWPTGGHIDLHDHGTSAGVVAVASGELRETTPVEDGTGIGSWLTRVVSSGESVGFGPHYVHGLVNVEESTAVSVHVYSPRLTSMTYFELTDGRLERSRTLRYQDGLLVP